jgi:hypothetical protein
MSAFDLDSSLDKARRRLHGRPPTGRRPRSDRGRLRIDQRVLSVVEEAAGGYDRPAMAEMRQRVAEGCRRQELAPPSRATLYKLLARTPTRTYRLGDLPPAVRNALYNLEPESDVPAHQVAFYCFNYGDLRAISFAAGLPWLALYQARRLPGFRAKSRGLLDAVATARGL